MAYANLVGVTCADTKEAFKRFRDFICKRNGSYDYSTTGIGWTLHDSSYATDEDNITDGDWIVLYSPGESGKDKLYHQITYKDGTNWYMGAVLYWDNTAHTFNNRWGYTTNSHRVNSAASNTQIWIYGDLDCILFGNLETIGAPASRYGFKFGKFKKPYDDRSDTIGVCSTAQTAGADKTLTLDIDPSGYWAVDDKLYLWSSGATNSNYEVVTISSMNSNSITVDLAKNHASTIMVSPHCGWIMTYSANMTGTLATVMYSNGVGPGTVLYTMYDSSIFGYANPDVFENGYIAVPEYYGHNSALYMGLYGRSPFWFRRNAGSTDQDVFTLGSVSYRYLEFYSGIHLFVKEV